MITYRRTWKKFAERNRGRGQRYRDGRWGWESMRVLTQWQKERREHARWGR